MKKSLLFCALVAVFALPGAAVAQTSTIGVGDMPKTFTFEEDDDALDYWTLTTGQTNGWAIGSGTALEGERSLYVSSDEGLTFGYADNASSTSYAYFDVEINEEGEYYLNFDWTCVGEGSYDYMEVYLVPATTAISGGSPAGSDWLNIGSRYSAHTGWAHAELTRTVATSELGSYHIVFMWKNDNSVSNGTPAAVDNVSIGKITCPAPTSLTATDISSEGATLSWTPLGDEGEWEVLLEGEPLDIVADTSYDFADLSPNTSYTVGVRAVCGDGDTSLLATTTFRTDCGLVSLPYTMDFEGLGFTASNGLIVPCWVRPFTSTTSDGRTFPCGSTSGSNATMGFAANAGETIIICTDPIPVNGDSLFVSFNVEMAGSAHFWCGVMTDPYDSTTFIPIGSGVHSACSWHNVLFTTIGLDPTNSYRVAFKYMAPGGFNGNWVNIDNILIRANNGCNEPTELTVASVSSSEAVLDWMVNGSESSWLLAVGADTIEISDKPYTLSLEPNTQYTVSLAALCATGDTTLFTEPTLFRSACEGDTCTLTVSSDDYYASVSVIQNGTPIATIESIYYGFNSVVYTCSDDALDLLVSGEVTVSNEADIELYSSIDATPTTDTIHIGQPCPDCMPVLGLSLDGSTSADAATLQWAAAGEEEQWVVYLDGEELATVSTPSYSFTGLEANTAYTAAVRAYCAEGDTSVVRRFSFRTACADGNCEFSVVATDSYGDGWDGQAAIYLYADGQQTESVRLASGSQATLEVSRCMGETLELKWHSGSHDDEIGFTILDAAGDTVVSVGNATYLTEGLLIATFDEACVATAEDLPEPGDDDDCLAPTNLTISNLTATEATLSWSPASVTDALWEVSCGSIVQQVQSPSYQLSDLTPGQTYNVSVVTLCDAYAGLVSTPATLAFTTPNLEGIGSVEQPLLTLRPNPASGVVSLDLEGMEEATVSIIDLNGREALRTHAEGSTLTLDISHLPSGTYFVRVVSMRTAVVGKLIVK